MRAAAQTLSLFDRKVVQPRPDGGRFGDGLRDYQRIAVDNAWAHLTGGVDASGDVVPEVPSTLIVMPTGTGKTQTFGAFIKAWKGRVLVLAHRDELIDQARKRVAQMTSEYVGLEKAEWTSGSERIVVASVQTLTKRRLKKWQANHFTLIVTDEAHHAVATSYRVIYDHFPEAKRLGVTATADRADERALEQVFETVAFVYEVQEAIDDEHLCPVSVKRVVVQSIDMTSVKKTAGDYNGAQLKQVFSDEETLHGVARPAVELVGSRKTLAFIDSVDNAHRLAEVINRYRPGAARAVDGETPTNDRRALFEGFARGDFQYLVNVNVATEGYDCPAVAAILMVRPTLSRALYAQMLGRGLRPYPGKDECLVVEFTGNSDRHKLKLKAVSAIDILGGTWDDDVTGRVREAAEKSEGGTGDVRAAAARAKRDIAMEKAREAKEAKEREARAAVQAEVTYRISVSDPFTVFGLEHGQVEDFDPRPASAKQIETLRDKFRVDIPDKGLTAREANKLIGTCIVRIKRDLARFRQVKTLARHGLDAKNWKRATASRVIDALVANGWRNLTADQVKRAIDGREMGED